MNKHLHYKCFAGLGSLRRRAKRVAKFCKNIAGVAGVEFAMIAPVMIIAYIGTVETGDLLVINRKVTSITHIAADLVAQDNSITNNERDNILNAATSVIYPYDTTKLKIVISCIDVNSSGVAKVTWSETLNGTKRTVGSTVTLPSGISENNTGVILAEVTYNYTTTLNMFSTDGFTLSDTFYMRPRLSTTVARTS